MTNPKVMALAREIAKQQIPDGSYSTQSLTVAMRSLVECGAFIAIERVTELAGELACHGSAKLPSQNDFTRGYADARGNLASALHNFHHLPEPKGGA